MPNLLLDHPVSSLVPQAKPLCGEGILLELVQAPADVIAAHNAYNANMGGC